MEFPDDLLYSTEHLWVREMGEDKAAVGITDFAQDQLGKVLYADLPAVGDTLVLGDEMGAVESAKSVSDLISPLNGEVVRVNETLADRPALLNDDPYGEGWLAEVELDGDLPGDLLSAKEYREEVGLNGEDG